MGDVTKFCSSRRKEEEINLDEWLAAGTRLRRTTPLTVSPSVEMETLSSNTPLRVNILKLNDLEWNAVANNLKSRPGRGPRRPESWYIGPIIGKGHAQEFTATIKGPLYENWLHPGSKHCSARTFDSKERADSQSHSGTGLAQTPSAGRTWTQSWLWYARSPPGLEK